MSKELEEKLIVGVKIKLGKKYAAFTGCPLDAGKEFELIQGYFEHDNGLYFETQTAPSIWENDEFTSIYHLFGNDLENFMDCEIINP